MRTNIDIPDKLMAKAQAAVGVKTKREAVILGLEELIRRKGQLSMLKWRGRIDWQGDLDEWRRD